jgi:hypothetical protein
MVKRACVFVAMIAAVACGDGNRTTPSPPGTPSNSAVTSPSNSFSTAPATVPTAGTISFDGLASAGDGAAVTSYSELGFSIVATSGSWTVWTRYGHPAPFIQFGAAAGSTVTGSIQVTAGGATFGFTSADFYSSTTKIPFTITGSRNAATVFTMADMLGNTFGTFKTVVNQQAGATIDTLTITLTNPAAACCPNPMGLDNIVVTR